MSNLTKLDAKAAAERFPGVYEKAEKKHALPPGVIGKFRLPRGSEFVSDLSLPSSEVYAFKVQTNDGGLTYAVVGRDLGDVTWPIFLEGQAAAAREDTKRIVKEGFADVLAWLAAAEQDRAAAEQAEADAWLTENNVIVSSVEVGAEEKYERGVWER